MVKGLEQRWSSYKSRLRHRYIPSLVDWLVRLSTYQARSQLRKMARVGILLDVTISQHAITHETGWVSTGTSNWGGEEMALGYSARIPVHYEDDSSDVYRNVSYLAGIADLCLGGHIDLYTSAELEDEKFRQPMGRYGRGYGYYDYSLLERLQIKSIDGHVFPALGPTYFGLPSAQAQQRSRLDHRRQNEIYRALVDLLGPKNSQDAWHIYTAEKYDLFCFLTMDFKLIRNVRAQSRGDPLKSFSTLVLTPEDFGKRFNLHPISPRLFSYHDATYPVRDDLTMPDGKRRPLKRYKRER
ncbi:MAG: hypothetical protein AAF986_07995 [Pseudomonadota bacterium]